MKRARPFLFSLAITDLSELKEKADLGCRELGPGLAQPHAAVDITHIITLR